MTRLRAARPASEIFDDVHAGGGWTQINHPKIFPSDNPTNASLCRGCSWDYSDAETDFSKVDAVEVTTGPAGVGEGATATPIQFALDAIAYWERILATGAHVAAVASSDSHTAGEPSWLARPGWSPVQTRQSTQDHARVGPPRQRPSSRTSSCLPGLARGAA